MARTSKNSSPVSTKAVDHFYGSYANTSSGVIDPEGIEKLCSDIGVAHTDVSVLMLAWKMNAERQGYFSKDEWLTGLKALQVDTVNKLKKALPELVKEVKDPSKFSDFCSFAFRYCLTEDKQKTIDIETICVLLDVVLGSQFRYKVDVFIKYLKDQKEYKVINMDQWMGFFRFCNEVNFSELQDYDSELAWPLIIDSFVEWLKER